MKASSIVNESPAFVNFRRQVLSVIGQENVSITYTCDYEKILFTAYVKIGDDSFRIIGNGKTLSGKWHGRIFRISK